MESKKVVGLFFLVLIVVNLLLFVSGKIGVFVFWLVIGLSAVVAYYFLPRM